MNIETVPVTSLDIHPTSVMNSVSTKMIQSLLTRMNIDYEKNLPKEAYLIAWYDEFLSNRDWILFFLPGVYLDFLVNIWDSHEIEMDELHWDMIKNLKLFGFITYRRGNKNNNVNSEIYVIETMKRNFYFYLKSHASVRTKEKFVRWENAFFGLSYYYGIISMRNMYLLFCDAVGDDVSYDDMMLFVRCRADLWGIGNVVQNRFGKEYFMNHNVQSPELQLLYMDEHKDLQFKKISYDDLTYVKQGYGIDNRWAGVSELGNFLVHDMNISYYRSTVLIHAILLDTQNGSDFDKIVNILDGISFSDKEQKKNVLNYVRMIYDNIPIFEYKGHTRMEYQSISLKKEKRNKMKRFTMLQGGK